MNRRTRQIIPRIVTGSVNIYTARYVIDTQSWNTDTYFVNNG